MNAIMQARFNRYLSERGFTDTADQHVWAFLGDGEMDEPESRGMIHIAATEGLDNYLFLVIGITVINSLANSKVSYAELLFTNIAMVGVTHLLEKVFLLKHETKREIIYEDMELIKPQRRAELIRDLENRTGLKINRVEIGRVDYLRDSARVFIFFFERDGWTQTGAEENQTGNNNDDD